MLDNRNTVLAFGPFRLFPVERRLERDGSTVRLRGRALDLLIVLIDHAGEIVPNRTLLADVWRDVSVEEGSLCFHIKNLRKALGDTQSGTSYVTNVRGGEPDRDGGESCSSRDADWSQEQPARPWSRPAMLADRRAQEAQGSFVIP